MALHRTLLPLALVLLVGVAGCAGAPIGDGDPADSATTTTASPDPPVSVADAEDRARWAEHDHVFAESVPADATASGTGGVSTTKAVVIGATDDGRFVRVRYAFWYEVNTSDGELHADGVSHAVHFVTANDTTRVSVPGQEMMGSDVGYDEATLTVQVVNAGAASRDVAVSVAGADGFSYDAETTVVGEAAARSPWLAVPGGDATVTATVDGEPYERSVSVSSSEDRPQVVAVLVAPDGTVVVSTPYRAL